MVMTANSCKKASVGVPIQWDLENRSNVDHSCSHNLSQFHAQPLGGIQTSVEIAAIIEQKVQAEKQRRKEFEALLKQMERRLEQAKRQEIDELTREINRVQQITTPRS